MGGPGAGHYVKMVHNGIEYGLMQAYAEGFELLHKSEYELDNEKIANLWGQGSVVRSWLLRAGRARLRGRRQRLAEPRGLGRGLRRGPLDARRRRSTTTCRCRALAAALYARFYSRGDGDYTARVLAALRNQFGGHAVKTGAKA